MIWRPLILQIHRWSGICIGLYVFFISLSGSLLVYRNEILELTFAHDENLRWLTNATYALMELHKNFMAGRLGLTLNGIGAGALLLLAVTGLMIWWPGINRLSKRLRVQFDAGSRRWLREIHGLLGFSAWVFIVMFACTGLYLCFQPFFMAMADRIEPMTSVNSGDRWVDTLQYYLAFLHFGRVNGISLPCAGPGFCDQFFKAIWALGGLVPALMFATGAVLWWRRLPGDMGSE
jgi:uncharacterized iron-regulated membrane protein